MKLAVSTKVTSQPGKSFTVSTRDGKEQQGQSRMNMAGTEKSMVSMLKNPGTILFASSFCIEDVYTHPHVAFRLKISNPST
jgi:hypothetical protein